MKSLVVVLAGGAALASCHSPSSDFKALCQTAGAVIQDPSIAPPEKPRVIEERFQSSPRHRRTRACIKLVFEPGLDVSVKYPVLEQCARDAGASGWSCPALRNWWGSASRPVTITP